MSQTTRTQRGAVAAVALLVKARSPGKDATLVEPLLAKLDHASREDWQLFAGELTLRNGRHGFRFRADTRWATAAAVDDINPECAGSNLVNTINPQQIVRDVVVIGASAGGHSAVAEILSRLPKELPAFVGVVIHRGAVSKSDWSHSLGSKTPLRAVEPSTGDPLARGVVYIAPSDCHMTFAGDRVWLDREAKEHFTRPAVDPLFISAARAYGPRVVAIVLTGGGHDGMQGLLHVTTAGGLCLVQKPSEAEHTSMPEYAIAHDHVRAALTVDEIGDALVLLAQGRAVGIDAADRIVRNEQAAAVHLAD